MRFSACEKVYPSIAVPSKRSSGLDNLASPFAKPGCSQVYATLDDRQDFMHPRHERSVQRPSVPRREIPPVDRYDSLTGNVKAFNDRARKLLGVDSLSPHPGLRQNGRLESSISSPGGDRGTDVSLLRDRYGDPG